MKYTEKRGVLLITIFSAICIILILLSENFLINSIVKESMQMPINYGSKLLKSK